MKEDSTDIMVVIHAHDQARNKKEEPLVDSCCCGCSLRTGCLIIVYLKLIAIAITIGVIVLISYAIVSETSSNDPNEEIAISRECVAVLTISVILEGLMTALLMIGILKEIPTYLHSYVNWCIVKSCLLLTGTILSMMNNGPNLNHITALIGFCLYLYFASVVGSFRRVLLKNEGCPPYTQLPNESPSKYEA